MRFVSHASLARGASIFLGAAILGGCARVEPTREVSGRNLEIVGGEGEVVTEHDSRDRPFRRVFHLRNPTDSPIEVLRVRTSCSCVKAEVAEGGVSPGRSVAVSVSISDFDPEEDEVRETVHVDTGIGTVPLLVAFRLPPSGQVLVSPRAFYLNGDEGAGGRRPVMLRVPAANPRRITERDVEVVDRPGARVSVTAEGRVGSYESYALRLVESPDGGADRPGGMVTVATGGETLRIPIIAAAKAP
jgi:hypothetical protein